MLAAPRRVGSSGIARSVAGPRTARREHRAPNLITRASSDLLTSDESADTSSCIRTDGRSLSQCRASPPRKRSWSPQTDELPGLPSHMERTQTPKHLARNEVLKRSILWHLWRGVGRVMAKMPQLAQTGSRAFHQLVQGEIGGAGGI
jgi:hypothetical protein